MVLNEMQMHYKVKHVQNGHSQKDRKIVFQVQLLLNAGQKYCRMLQWGAFCNTFDLHLATICQYDLYFVYFSVAVLHRLYCISTDVLNSDGIPERIFRKS